jgi:hypothetical protein
MLHIWNIPADDGGVLTQAANATNSRAYIPVAPIGLRPVAPSLRG